MYCVCVCVSCCVSSSVGSLAPVVCAIVSTHSNGTLDRRLLLYVFTFTGCTDTRIAARKHTHTHRHTRRQLKHTNTRVQRGLGRTWVSTTQLRERIGTNEMEDEQTQNPTRVRRSERTNERPNERTNKEKFLGDSDEWANPLRLRGL